MITSARLGILSLVRVTQRKEVAIMSIVFILLGALASSLFVVAKLGLGHPPVAHLESVPTAKTGRALSQQDIKLAA